MLGHWCERHAKRDGCRRPAKVLDYQALREHALLSGQTMKRKASVEEDRVAQDATEGRG
jgi:hypothetical protein